MRRLIVVLGLCMCQSLLHAQPAEPLMRFQKGQLVLRLEGQNRFAMEMEVLEENTRILTPNFWSTHLQAANLDLPLAGLSADGFLTLKVRGRPHGVNPLLRLLVFNENWSRRSEWNFDLSGIKADEFIVVRASTPLGRPLPASNMEPVRLTEDKVAGLQIFLKADASDQPWELVLESISFVAAP